MKAEALELFLPSTYLCLLLGFCDDLLCYLLAQATNLVGKPLFQMVLYLRSSTLLDFPCKVGVFSAAQSFPALLFQAILQEDQGFLQQGVPCVWITHLSWRPSSQGWSFLPAPRRRTPAFAARHSLLFRFRSRPIWRTSPTMVEIVNHLKNRATQ